MRDLLGLLLVGAAVTACCLARRRRHYRPVAAMLVGGLLTDLVQGAYHALVIVPLRDDLGVGVPWTGWARVAGAGADALALAWPAQLLAAMLAITTKHPPWLAAVAWAAAAGAVAAVHGGDRALAVADTALVAAALLVLAIDAVREGAHFLSAAKATAVMVLAAEVVSLFGAWRLGVTSHWYLAQVLYAILLGAVVLNQGRLLWKPGCSAPASR